MRSNSASAGGDSGDGMLMGSMGGRSLALTVGSVTALAPRCTLLVSVTFLPLYTSPPCGQMPSGSSGKPVLGLGKYAKLLDDVTSMPMRWPAAKIQQALHMS